MASLKNQDDTREKSLAQDGQEEKTRGSNEKFAHREQLKSLKNQDETREKLTCARQSRRKVQEGQTKKLHK